MVVMRKISNFSHHHHQKRVKGDFSSMRKNIDNFMHHENPFLPAKFSQKVSPFNNLLTYYY